MSSQVRSSTTGRRSNPPGVTSPGPSFNVWYQVTSWPTATGAPRSIASIRPRFRARDSLYTGSCQQGRMRDADVPREEAVHEPAGELADPGLLCPMALAERLGVGPRRPQDLEAGREHHAPVPRGVRHPPLELSAAALQPRQRTPGIGQGQPQLYLLGRHELAHADAANGLERPE